MIRWMTLLLLLVTGSMTAVNAQNPNATDLDAYPDCGFTESSGMDNLIVGAVVINLETGNGCVENLDHSFQTASVPKLFIAGAYYDWVSRGLVSRNTPVTFTQEYVMNGRTDCLRAEDVGRRYELDELVDEMITCSDNSATWLVMDTLGWGRVQEYIDNLGIEGIGPVLPYAFVDRMKLAYIDPRWEDVPAGLASSYYRSREVTGLDAYFDEVPDIERGARRDANARYMESSEYNVLTPRALAQYFIKLRDDLNAMSGTEAIAARLLFNTMLSTQREHGTQAFPGTVMVGSKNGFDTGLKAEANIVFDDADARVPSGLAILFTQQPDLSSGQIQPANADRDEILARYLRGLSPQLVEILYPDYEKPELGFNLNVSTVLFQIEENMNACWQPYRRSGYDGAQVNFLESCWGSVTPRTGFSLDETMGVGIVLRRLNANDFTRLVLVFTAPSGTQYSYQTFLEFESSAGVYWLHPIDERGTWEVDIYVDLEYVYTSSVSAG